MADEDRPRPTLDEALSTDGSFVDHRADEAVRGLQHSEELHKLLEQANVAIELPAASCPKCGEEDPNKLHSRSNGYYYLGNCTSCGHTWQRAPIHPTLVHAVTGVPMEVPDLPRTAMDVVMDNFSAFRDPRKNHGRGDGEG